MKSYEFYKKYFEDPLNDKIIESFNSYEEQALFQYLKKIDDETLKKILSTKQYEAISTFQKTYDLPEVANRLHLSYSAAHDRIFGHGTTQKGAIQKIKQYVKENNISIY